jgi:hypothetical protein
MKPRLLKTGFFLLLALAAAALLLPGLVAAAPHLPLAYQLPWWTVDGGGASPTGGSGYSLSGTIGQPDAGTLTGGGYSLSGGFWHPAQSGDRVIYVPLIRKQ